MKRLNSNTSILGLVLVLGLSVTAAPGCSSDDGDKKSEDLAETDVTEGDVAEEDITEGDTAEETIEPAKKTAIRVLHLSPDAPAVDVWVNGAAAAISNLAFPDGTAYVEIDEGSYTFDVVPAGGAVADSVLNVALELAGDKKYTAVAIGELASIAALALEDNYAGLEEGNIRIRAIHAAPVVGEVDIWVIPGEGEPFALYENVPFGVAGEYKDVPAGAYTLGFDANNDAIPDLIFKTPALAAGTVANVFAVNDAAGKVFLRAQFEDGSLATIEAEPAVEPAKKTAIRVLHLSPDAPAVDVWVNGAAAAVEDLAFPEGTGYLEIDEGSYTFDIVPAGGALADSVLDVALDLMADKKYTAVAFGNVATLGAMALEDNYAGLAEDNIRLRAIHAAPAVGEVDIWVIPGEGEPFALYENVPFGVDGEYKDVPAGAYTLGFDANNDGIPDLIFKTPALAAGTVANVFAVNDAAGKVFLRAQFEDGSLATIEAEPAVEPAKKTAIRVLHLSPDAPAVDVWVNGAAAAVEDLAFPEGTGYLEIDEGAYTFDIVPAGGVLADSVLDVALDLMADKKYTAVAIGNVATLGALALEDDYTGLEAGNIRIRAIHAAPAVGEVDIWVIPTEGSPFPLYENVPFGVAGAYVDVPAGAYTLGIDATNDASPDLIFNVPSLPAGTVANVFAVNDAMGSVALRAQFEDGSLVTISPSM